MSDVCEACGAALKVGMLSSNQRLHQARLKIISLDEGKPVTSACNKCGDERYRSSKQRLEQELEELRNKVRTILSFIPVVSLQNPTGWNYSPLTIVTAQTVTGTGIFSDVASAFTDLFGTQSGSYNAKLREGENLCKTSLRTQALELGANAVLAVDVDYAEVGGQRAMLMVCMTGTAVRIESRDPPDDSFFERTAEGVRLASRLRETQQALQAPEY